MLLVIMFPSLPAFCASPLHLQSPKRKRPLSTCRCTASPHPQGEARVSRRTLLLGLAGLIAAPHIPSAKADEKEPKPIAGFQTKSGLKYFDFELGEGPTPRWGDMLNIQYVAYTITPDGSALVRQDSSFDYGKQGYLIHHGNGEHILGLEEALHTMSVGGRRRCIIPRDMAYWKSGLGPVPLPDGKRRAFSRALTDGDGTVVFDVELTRIWHEKEDTGYYDDLVPTDEELLQIWQEQEGKNLD